MKKREGRNLSPGKVWLNQLVMGTWAGDIKWRRSAGCWKLHSCKNRQEYLIWAWKIYLAGEILVAYNKEERQRSDPLPGRDLGPLLEAIIFSREEE